MKMTLKRAPGFTVLSLLCMEYKWIRWILAIWAFIAGIQLAFLVLGWYLGGKQAAKLAELMKGMGGPAGRDL